MKIAKTLMAILLYVLISIPLVVFAQDDCEEDNFHPPILFKHLDVNYFCSWRYHTPAKFGASRYGRYHLGNDIYTIKYASVYMPVRGRIIDGFPNFDRHNGSWILIIEPDNEQLPLFGIAELWPDGIVIGAYIEKGIKLGEVSSHTRMIHFEAYQRLKKETSPWRDKALRRKVGPNNWGPFVNSQKYVEMLYAPPSPVKEGILTDI